MASAGDRITRLQHHVQALIDGDRVLPADGSSLLAALGHAQEGLLSEDRPAERAALEAFVSRVQALMATSIVAGDPEHAFDELAKPVAVCLLDRHAGNKRDRKGGER
jgi:hypothetical protein